MITEGLDYDRHYKVFNETEIGKLEDQSRAIMRKAQELKRSCRHPEKHL